MDRLELHMLKRNKKIDSFAKVLKNNASQQKALKEKLEELEKAVKHVELELTLK